MSDLTKGPIARHIVTMAGFLAAALAFQSAYFMVDLYFVSRIGPQALAGVGSTGSFLYLALAASQLVGVGSLSLISHAVGRKDEAHARLVFNQVLALSLLLAGMALVAGYVCAAPVARALGADMSTAGFGRAYLYGDLPALALMFPGTVMGASLRACGIVRPTMVLQSASVLLNVILAPVLIAGWGTGHPLGAFGAGLASSIAAVLSLAAILLLLPRIQTTLRLTPSEMRPDPAVWLGLMKVGLPAAGEFLLMFLVNVAVYWSIRRFGPDAQAGYGIGARLVQALFLPTMAISFAAAPVAGQNFGAGHRARVLETFRTAMLYAGCLMLGLTVLCQFVPKMLTTPFTADPAVIAITCQYLRIVSWNFVAIGVVFTCSGMFQALGDTRPAFVSSATRLATFVLPCMLLAQWSPATLLDFWLVSILAGIAQAAFSLWLLARTFRAKMPPEAAAMRERPVLQPNPG